MNEIAQEAVTVSTAVPLVSPRLPYHLVDTDDALKVAIDKIRATNEPIAIDAERASGFRYGQKAYLIQVGVKGEDLFLIDPVANYEQGLWEECKEVLSSKPWIIHAASQDIPCLAEIGIKPIQVLDTELGSRILGLPRVSLGTITEHYLDLKLAKEHSAVDWSERPLRKEWLEYAALDIDVLHELWEKVHADLISKEKLEIATAEFDYLISQPVKAPKTERWRSMTGLHEIKEVRALTIAKALWEARENLAIDKDVAPGRLIPDSAIVAAVKAMPKSRSELATLKTFSGKASRTFLDTWWDAFVLGNTTKGLVELRAKPTGIPNHRNWPIKFPDAHARLLASKAALMSLSEELQIPQENILNPEVLRSICFEPPAEISHESVGENLAAKGARTWQIDAVVDQLVTTLKATPADIKEKAVISED
jgi:ribonuclease D